MHSNSKNLSDYFNICVKFIEAKDLPDANISSLVCIQVGEQKKNTKTIKNTNTPYFDEYFVFEMYTDFQSLLSTVVTISIFQPRKKFRFKKLIGSIYFDIGIIWSQPNQRLQNWLPLTVPSDYSAQVKGLLMCIIKVEAPASYVKLVDLEDPGMINPFLGKRVRYRIKIYKCVGLKFETNENAPDVSVRVIFAGKIGSTTERKLRQCVEWNEQVTFIATFPPRFHKLTIELVVGKSVISKHFNFFESLKFLKSGYSFGPTYVHLYMNESTYCGSLFMAIETDSSGLFKESDKLHKITTLPIEKPTKQIFGDPENFLCVGLLFDAMLDGRKWGGSNIQLALNFGFTGQNVADKTKNILLTDNFKAVPGNSDFSYLPINKQKPCVFVRSEWPDYTHRLQNSNMISNITHNLRTTINLVEEYVARGKALEAKNAIKSSLRQFKQDCQELSGSLLKGINDLDIGRVQFLSTFLKFKLPQLVSSCIEESSLELVLKKSISLLNVVDELTEDIQESLPCIVLSLKNKHTVLGSSKINPRCILFSKKSKRRGHDCGKIVSVLIKSTNNKFAGRLDVWLWLGFWDEVAHCIKELPPGHEDLSKIVSLPFSITYDSFERYVIYCRIYSGYIVDSRSCANHCDTFVRVLYLNQSQQTKPVKKSMAPTWKETLCLSDIRLYTPHAYNQDYPPILTVELWNQATNPPNRIGVELVKMSCAGRIQAEKEFNLQWLKIEDKAKILSAFEIIRVNTQPNDPFNLEGLTITNPKVLDPVTVPFRLEVVFWGIRPVAITGLNKKVTRVQAIIQCSSSELKSNIITQTMTSSLSFQHDLHILPLQLPSVNLFSPPLILQIIADNTYVGCIIERNVHRYEHKLPTRKEWEALYIQRRSLIDIAKSRHSSFNESMPDLIPLMEIDSRSRTYSDEITDCGFKLCLKNIFNRIKPYFSRARDYLEETTPINLEFNTDEEDYNWWFGYFSGEVHIYRNELEDQNEFNRFNDVLETYLIKEQKEGKFIESMKVKTLMCLYEWPTEKKIVTLEGQDPETGVLRLTELRERVKLLVRVYCVRAHNLNPSDPNGLADPYIEIATPSNCISDKYNYISKQLNPVFGKCLEIPATLPTDSILTVRVMDWDMFTASDLIGETDIDIENRFYSKHRAACGLPKAYAKTGYNAWRDIEKPTDVLEKLCNTYNLPLPQYFEKSVLIGSKEFLMTKPEKNKQQRQEMLALLVLNKWKEMPIVGRLLVPQHVETRSLYLKNKPGLERGKLELWVDLFDQSSGEIPPPIDIQPSEPELYELRVVILNTAKVPLVDDSFFVGKKHTDIFVKGWLWDPDESQTTDIHYTSLNGSGYFNWRFIFQFLYLKHEKRMVIYKKDLFSVGKSESRVPALLHLQVWDSDRISPDDFIGAMVLELCNMPRGSISLTTCKLKHYINPTQTVDLFKVKRLRGWWPFFQMTTDIEPKDAGFLEAQFHLLTKEEALLNPAGLGRAPPNALQAPARPSIRIKFWLAPFRAIFYFLCMVNKGKMLLCLLSTATVLFVLVGIYSLPIFIIKRLLGA